MENETITDRLIPKDHEIVRAEDEYLSPKPKPYGPTLELVVSNKAEDVDVFVNRTPLEDESTLKARRFLELVESGDSPTSAARKVDSRSNVSKIVGAVQDKDLRGKLKKLLERGRLPAEVRKEMVRAGLNDVFLEHVDGSPKNQKLALAAAKLISDDPEVGLNAPIVTPGVTIDMGKFGELLGRMKPIEGLEEVIDITVKEND